MNEKGIKTAYFMGADYQAGWEKIDGAMRTYKGKTADASKPKRATMTAPAELEEEQKLDLSLRPRTLRRMVSGAMRRTARSASSVGALHRATSAAVVAVKTTSPPPCCAAP